jgi:hypothetical protein
VPQCSRCGVFGLRGRIPREYDYNICGACHLESGDYDKDDADDLRSAAHNTYRRQKVAPLRGRILTNILIDEEFDELSSFTKWHLLALNTALLRVRPPLTATKAQLRERLYDAFEMGYSDEECNPETPFHAYELTHLAIETAVAEPIHSLDTSDEMI